MPEAWSHYPNIIIYGEYIYDNCLLRVRTTASNKVEYGIAENISYYSFVI